MLWRQHSPTFLLTTSKVKSQEGPPLKEADLRWVNQAPPTLQLSRIPNEVVVGLHFVNACALGEQVLA